MHAKDNLTKGTSTDNLPDVIELNGRLEGAGHLPPGKMTSYFLYKFVIWLSRADRGIWPGIVALCRYRWI